MLALQLVEKETDPVSGLPMSVVTDPANQFKFVTRRPTTNWAARTLAADQNAYYAPFDEAAKVAGKPPVSRAGHLWSVYLPKDTTQ